jgi:NhaP-type Na+/H+ or K+/H+ antiporter
MVVFTLNGLVFILIGLQLSSILQALSGRSLVGLIGFAALIAGVVIVVRLVWVFAARYLIWWLARLKRRRVRRPNPGEALVVGWTGMRGVVSLATALALPFGTPERDLLIFVTFCVILATLVGQGLSLVPIIQLLDLQPDSSLEREHTQAHIVGARAALSRLDQLATEEWVPQDALTHLRSFYEKKLETLTSPVDEAGNARSALHSPMQQRLRQEILKAERAAIIRLRDRGRIDDETLRLVERELDLEEQRLQE